MGLTKQVMVIVVVLAGAGYSGWHGRGLHEDSKALSALQASVEQSNKDLAKESAIAKLVGSKLDELTASETIIDRGIIREVEKPVYRNVCLDDSVIRMLNEAATGSGPAGSASATSQVSD